MFNREAGHLITYVLIPVASLKASSKPSNENSGQNKLSKMKEKNLYISSEYIFRSIKELLYQQ